MSLSMVGKDAADRPPFPPLDLLVEVDEWSREPRGEPPTDGALARAWKADQNNVRCGRQSYGQLPFPALKRLPTRATYAS